MLDCGGDIDPSDDAKFFPVVESDKVFALDCEQTAAEYAFVSKRSFERLELGTVLVYLDGAVFCAACIGVRVVRARGRPHKLSGASKGSGLVLGVSVDNEVVFAQDCEGAATGGKLHT